MALIRCDVALCRYNRQRRCTLRGIQIGPGVVLPDPPAMGGMATSYGQLRAGYAQEFDAYAAFAEELAPEARPGAACLSFVLR